MIALKLALCLTGWLAHGSAVELSTRRGELSPRLWLLLGLGLALILCGAFLGVA